MRQEISLKKIIGILCFFSITWLLLSGYLTNPLLLILGFISVAITIFFMLRMDIIDPQIYQLRWIIPMFKYWIYLIKEIFLSNIDVSMHVLSGGARISPEMRYFILDLKTDYGKVLYANSITLTPGTITVRLRDQWILVHALSASGIKSLEENTMQMNIKKVELKSLLPIIKQETKQEIKKEVKKGDIDVS